MTGNELKEARTNLGLTQEEFGQRLGVRKNTVWRWENEHRHITESIARLVDYLVKEVRAEQLKKKK